MPIRQIITTGRVPVKIFTDEIEPQAYAQLAKIAELPIIHSHIAAMPDVHLGIGATVGSVIPTLGAIIPAAVGVDIGCGMNAVQLSLTAEDLPDNPRRLRSAIESVVPVGFATHKSDIAKRSTIAGLQGGLDRILERHPKIANLRKKSYLTWVRQLGTLGGGNHFIEICLDENEKVWVMLHSGSRGIGNAIGRYFIALAKQDAERISLSLPDRDLAYFREGAEHFDDYVAAVEWAQNYAKFNRREMMRLILDQLKRLLPHFEIVGEAINCHHNYVARETHFGESVYLTRKGAIRAGQGELGIIPGSMGTKSFIVKGKGESSSFESCAHGAGRAMSRTQAKKRFTVLDMEAQTAGIECRKDEGVIDEIPAAYKDIDQVMEHQSDLVDVVHTLKQIVCIKG
ncbi:MAG: tRNA-splicing ligase RtcB [Gammaproteobacteria bacterium]|jgi:tRNA-splicing ligase RtcB